MSIEVECSGGHTLQVRDAFAGKQGRCPECGAIITVPDIQHESRGDATKSSRLEAAGAPASSPSSVSDSSEGSGIDLLSVDAPATDVSLKQCPRCRQKVTVGDDKTCPNCGAFFVYWA